jgi:hypothetical protein
MKCLQQADNRTIEGKVTKQYNQTNGWNNILLILYREPEDRMVLSPRQNGTRPTTNTGTTSTLCEKKRGLENKID